MKSARIFALPRDLWFIHSLSAANSVCVSRNLFKTDKLRNILETAIFRGSL